MCTMHNLTQTGIYSVSRRAVVTVLNVFQVLLWMDNAAGKDMNFYR